MNDFVYEALPARVIFGSGTLAKLTEEAERLHLSKLLILSTPEQTVHAERAAGFLGAKAIAQFPRAQMHTPVEVTQAALQVVQEHHVDGLVAIGGGSTTGLAKAIALRTDLPQIIVPTTYAGSEVTPILGETQDGLKKTLRSLKVLPEVVLYDVDLTLSLPPALSVTSGLNAVAHAAEALYAPDYNPIIGMMAQEGIRALVAALPKIIHDTADRDGRRLALYGAWLCGTCLGAVGMSLHHKLCHTLGGTFDLPHAETHSVVLPHALAFNLAAAPRASSMLAAAVDCEKPALKLFELARELGAPTSLRQLGMPESGIDKAADLALKSPYSNPRPLERQAIRELIARAWAGERPKEA